MPVRFPQDAFNPLVNMKDLAKGFGLSIRPCGLFSVTHRNRRPSSNSAIKLWHAISTYHNMLWAMGKLRPTIDYCPIGVCFCVLDRILKLSRICHVTEGRNLYTDKLLRVFASWRKPFPQFQIVRLHAPLMFQPRGTV